MQPKREVVITGVGVVSPIGTGRLPFWASLAERRSGVAVLSLMEGKNPTFRFGGALTDFDARQYVQPRKALKVMCLEIQAGYAAAALAMQDAGLAAGKLDPDRLGVVMGTNLFYCEPAELELVFRNCIEDGEFHFDRWAERAMSDIYPLWMLKHLPNMAACQIGIPHDARAHNNTITLAEVSGLLSLIEAAGVIERGRADVMIAGGTGSRLSLTPMIYRGDVQLSHCAGDPARASRPFDARREGMVNGEGAGVLILESREHAEARSAPILGRLLGYGRSFGFGDGARRVAGIERSIRWALESAGVEPREIGHVNAHGLGTIEDDSLEARAIHSLLGDTPVTALKSYFGHLGSGGGVVELAGSVLGLVHGEVPATLNYEFPDPACPVNVVHEPQRPRSSLAISLTQSNTGQAAAVVVAGP